MQAFHNDPAIKSRYLDRVRIHARADEIIHGKYWENGKGCAVGCTIHSNQHMAYETELGVPVMLARLEDRLFEGMTNGRAKAFPEQFLLAAKVGADLSLVGWKFLYWLLTEELACRDNPRVSAQIKRCAAVLVPLTKGEACDREEARAAAHADAAAAYADAYAAAAAAYADAYAAAYAAHAAAHAADDDDDDAAHAAAHAADDAADAYAYADAYTADAYTADAAAYADARQRCYERMAEKLLALMAECEGEPLRVAMGMAA